MAPAPTTPPSTHPRRAAPLICLCLGLAVAAVYWPVVKNGFINLDDPDYITGNPRVLAGLTPAGVSWAFLGYHSSNWHPLTWISHMLDVQLYGNKPAGHHVTSLVLHACNSILLFLLLRRLTGALWRSAMVAALFALHPLHVESVAWVSERKDVLSAFFGLLAIWAYADYVYARTPPARLAPKVEAGRPGKPRPAWVYYLLTFVCLLFGLMAKPMLVTWPCLLLVLDFWPLQRLGLSGFSPAVRLPATRPEAEPTLARLILEKIPFFVLAAGSCLVTFLVQQASGAMVSLANTPFASRLVNAIAAYGWYVLKLVSPANLSVFYPHPPLSWDSPAVIGSLVFMVAVTAACFLGAQRRPYLLTGWLWFLGTLVPVIGLIQVGKQAWADRYTYLPYIGLFIMFTWGAAEILARGRRRWVATTLAGLVIVACGARSYREVGYWRDTKTLFLRSLEVTSNNYVAESVVAAALLDEGKLTEALERARESLRISPDYSEAHQTLANIYARQEKYDEAIASFRRAAASDATYGDPHYGLAMIFIKQGKLAEAETEARETLRLSPLHLGARFALATALHNQGKVDQAAEAYRQILEVNPNLYAAQRYLGNALVAQGKAEEAIPHFLAALKLRPNDADTHTVLGLALVEKGRTEEAGAQFNEAVRLEPTNAPANYQLALLAQSRQQSPQAIRFYQQVLATNPDWADALNNLAWLLAANANPAVRNGAQAVALAEHACRITDSRQPLFLGTLAAAYAEAGRFSDATDTAGKAIQLAQEAGQTDLARRNQELLEIYRAGKAYHEAE